MSKAKRKGRIFIDYLRNQRGSTAIMPYSVRAREHAPVAAPIGWDALADAESAGHWTIRDADALLERAGSPELKGWAFARQKLPRSEEHTSELQSLMRISYAVFCLKKKK